MDVTVIESLVELLSNSIDTEQGMCEGFDSLKHLCKGNCETSKYWKSRGNSGFVFKTFFLIDYLTLKLWLAVLVLRDF